MILFTRITSLTIVLISNYLFANPIQTKLIQTKYCSTVSLEMLRKQRFEDNTNLIQKEEVLTAVGKFIELTNEITDKKKLPYPILEKQKKIYLSAFIVHFHPLEALSLQNKKRPMLNKIASHIVENHKKICSHLNIRSSFDIEDQESTIKHIIKTNKDRNRFNSLFEDFIKINYNMMATCLIRNFIAIEKEFLKYLNKKDSLSNTLAIRCSIQLLNLKAKIKKLDKTNGLKKLDAMRQETFYTISPFKYQYINTSSLTNRYFKRVTKDKLFHNKKLEDYVDILISHRNKLSFKAEELFNRKVFKKLLTETILDLIHKQQTFNFRNIPFVLYPYINYLRKIKTTTTEDHMPLVKKLIYNELLSRNDTEIINHQSVITTSKQLTELIQYVHKNNHLLFFEILYKKQINLTFLKLTTFQPLKADMFDHLSNDQFLRLQPLHSTIMKLAFTINNLIIIKRLHDLAKEPFNMKDLVSRYHLDENEKISIFQLQELFVKIFIDEFSSSSFKKQAEKQQKIISRPLIYQIGFKHIYRSLLHNIKQSVKYRKSSQVDLILPAEELAELYKKVLSDFHLLFDLKE